MILYWSAKASRFYWPTHNDPNRELDYLDSFDDQRKAVGQERSRAYCDAVRGAGLED